MKRLYDILTIIAMTTTPAAAAIFFGWRVYSATLTLTGSKDWAIAAGLATAIALESVGILAGHLASEFWRRRDSRWIVAAVVMGIYVLVGMIELWGTTGAVVFVLSPAVYLLAALRHTAEIEAIEDKQRQSENEAETKRLKEIEDRKATEERAWQQQQSERAAERQHELDLERVRSQQAFAIEQARIAAEAAIEQQRAKAELIRAKAEQREQERLYIALQKEQEETERVATESRIECEDCGHEFATVQALNAHGRWCKAKSPVMSNGKVAR